MDIKIFDSLSLGISPEFDIAIIWWHNLTMDEKATIISDWNIIDIGVHGSWVEFHTGILHHNKRTSGQYSTNNGRCHKTWLLLTIYKYYDKKEH